MNIDNESEAILVAIIIPKSSIRIKKGWSI